MAKRNSESSNPKKKRTAWKYSKRAEKMRFCECCHAQLSKDEAYFCDECHKEFVLGKKQEVKDDETD